LGRCPLDYLETTETNMVKFPVLVAVAFVALMTVAAVLPAPAHTDTSDAQFVSFLDSHGIPYDSPDRAVKEAKAGCLVLREGHSFVSAVQGLSGIQTNYSEDTAATFLGAAIGAYCPDQISKELN
jgi:hypothetical protein